LNVRGRAPAEGAPSSPVHPGIGTDDPACRTRGRGSRGVCGSSERLKSTGSLAWHDRCPCLRKGRRSRGTVRASNRSPHGEVIMQSLKPLGRVAASVLRRLALPTVVAATLMGGLVAGESSASAQVIAIAPPAPRVEIIPPAPSPAHVWAPGYWGWRGRGYAWYGGRWQVGRPGYAWARPHWDAYGGRWHFAPGRWRRR
jgi:hypothetical protein